MKSKVLLLAIATTVCSLAAQAQLSFGIRAGINFQNINGEDPGGHDLSNDLKTGFHIGANVEIPLVPDFYIQPGLLFSTKGASGEDYASKAELKTKLSYVELPINLLYKPAFGPGKLLLGFGPYVAYAVGGSGKYGDKEGDVQFESKVGIGDYAAGYVYGRPYYKRMDVGGNLLVGYELAKKISFQLNAQLGMAKINPEVTGLNDQGKARNTGFGISVGYRF